MIVSRQTPLDMSRDALLLCSLPIPAVFEIAGSDQKTLIYRGKMLLIKVNFNESWT